MRAARAQWTPVWVVVDGSTDGSAEGLQAMAATDAGLHVIVLPENRGKGAAVLAGITRAAAAGFTHALTMDSDGQHPADLIPAFMAASQADPGATGRHAVAHGAQVILVHRVAFFVLGGVIAAHFEEALLPGRADRSAR